jgi:hypothetical protein
MPATTMKKFKLILPAFTFLFGIGGALATSPLLASDYTWIGNECIAITCDSQNPKNPLCSIFVFYANSECTGEPYFKIPGRIRILNP